jgi:hypothetical protein
MAQLPPAKRRALRELLAGLNRRIGGAGLRAEGKGEG